MGALINTSGVTAKAYGRRRPKYPVIPETLGLAVLLIANRNTAADHGVWLASPAVHDALCEPAEAFAAALEGRAADCGWRGGALASLRSLVPGTVHEAIEPLPWIPEPELVERFWLDDAEPVTGWQTEPSPVRRELLARLGGHPHLEDAWLALHAAWNDEPSYAARRGGRTCAHRGVMAGFGNLHDHPHQTRRLHSWLTGTA